MPPAILTAKRVCEVRVVENIEKFRADLHLYALAKMEEFDRRKIRVSESEIAKRIAAHCPKCAGRRWRHD